MEHSGNPKRVMHIKKVCILSSVHSAFDTRVFHKEAKTLVKSGYKVTLICQHRKSETINGIEIIALHKPSNRFFRMFGTTWELFRLANKEKADVYHFHDPELIIVAILLKMLTKGKLIYDVHEDVPLDILTKDWIGNPKIRKAASYLFDKFEKFSCKFIDIIVVVTPSIAKKFPPGKTILVRNMPDVSTMEKIRNQDVNKINFSAIYAGGLTRIRGIKEIIQAIGSIENNKIDLLLLGEWESKDFEKECKSLKEWNRVKFFGFVPFLEMNKYLLKADVGLLCFLPEPNNVNAMPNKMFEYMITGLPVVASNFPLWKEIIEGNNCGICVNPYDPKEIAKAIEHLMEHPDEVKKMRRNGIKAVLQNYNWENESKKLLEVYEELCTGKSGYC